VFVPTASWASLHCWSVGIHLMGKKVQALSLPPVITLVFDQNSFVVVGVGFELAGGDELMNPGCGASQPPGRPFGIQYLHYCHEKPRTRKMERYPGFAHGWNTKSEYTCSPNGLTRIPQFQEAKKEL